MSLQATKPARASYMHANREAIIFLRMTTPSVVHLVNMEYFVMLIGVRSAY